MRKKEKTVVKTFFSSFWRTHCAFGNILFCTFGQIHRAPQIALLSFGYVGLANHPQI